MAYATTTDLIARFGEAEMIRLTTPEGQDLAGVNAVQTDKALAVASGLIDSYLRRRYAVPLVVVPVEIAEATQMLARYSLAFGENREPTEQMRSARRDTIAWLDSIASGRVTLNGVAPIGAESQAMTTDRNRQYGATGWSGVSDRLTDW